MPLRVELTQLVPQLDGLGQALWLGLSKPKQFHTIPHAHAAPCGIDSTRTSTRRLSPPKPKQFHTIPHAHAAPCGIDSTRTSTRRLSPPKPKQFHTIPHAHAAPCGIDSTRTSTRRLDSAKPAPQLDTLTPQNPTTTSTQHPNPPLPHDELSVHIRKRSPDGLLS